MMPLDEIILQLKLLELGYGADFNPKKSALADAIKILEYKIKVQDRWYDINVKPEIVTVKPAYKVLVRFANEDDERLMLFDSPVHIKYDFTHLLQVGIYDDLDNCLFLASWNVIEYCQVISNTPEAPTFMTKHMNIPIKKDKTTCKGCIYEGSGLCHSPRQCKELSDGTRSGYTNN